MNTLILRYLLLLILCGWAVECCCPEARAAGSNDFAAGNARYAAGDFAGASKAYEAQIRSGEFTANNFYNLGDAYYRQGDRGRAILNYRRALLLEPSHPEAASNLAFVTGGKPADTGRGGVAAILRERSPWTAAVCGWVGLVGVLVWVGSRRRRTLGLGLAAAGFALCALGAGLVWYFDQSAGNAARAVVVAEATPALYSPADNSKVVTTLAAGAEVRVLSEQGAWVYALLADGATHGWLASDKVEPLVPR